MLSIVELARKHNLNLKKAAVSEFYVYYILGHPLDEALNYFKQGTVDVLYDPGERKFFPVYPRPTTIPKVPA